MDAAALRSLPAVHRVLGAAEVRPYVELVGHGVAAFCVRRCLAKLRGELLAGTRAAAPPDEVLELAVAAIRRAALPGGRRVINASGILLDARLGRAPLAPAVLPALRDAAGYSLVGLDPETGDAAPYDARVEAVLRELTGCAAATVVNNDAAGVYLALNTLAAGREVAGRGRSAEVGCRRLADLVALSGATLRAVGTPNRTCLPDYEAALSDRTGALLHARPSGRRAGGGASAPGVRELVGLAKARGVALVDDLRGGGILPLAGLGPAGAGTVGGSLRAGADVVCFGGETFAGGPRCGVVCGRAAVVAALRANPLYRLVGADELTIAALEATLLPLLNGPAGRATLPLSEMLARPVPVLDEMARTVRAAVGPVAGCAVSVADGTCFVGGGASPDRGVPSRVIRIVPAAPGAPDPAALARALRTGFPSVLARVHAGAVLLDMRTLLRDDVPLLAPAVRAAADSFVSVRPRGPKTA